MKGKPKRKKFTVRKIGKHRFAVFAILPIIQTDSLTKAKKAKQSLDKLKAE
jgi:hypothetical protein